MRNLAPPLPGTESIEPAPVLFWGEKAERSDCPFAELRSATVLVFHVDIIAATLFMLSRWEEAVVPARDEHDRFPSTASVAWRQGILERPIVDEYALILRAWLRALLPDWTPQARRFSVRLSHDIDVAVPFATRYAAARALGEVIVREHDIRKALSTAVEVASAFLAPDRTPPAEGIRLLATLSSTHGLKSAFYFMAARRSHLDSGYSLGAHWLRRCVADLQRRGFEIGIHPSYRTLDNPARLAEEKARFDDLLGLHDYGGRQHYLRFRAPHTWRHWEELGLTYDSTVGYADHVGFRCGTCQPFRPFDLEQNRELNLWERPLVAMDTTLRDYLRLTPQQGEACIVQLARRCQRVGGEFTLLWHNTSLGAEWQPWGEMYERVLGVLAGMVATEDQETG